MKLRANLKAVRRVAVMLVVACACAPAAATSTGTPTPDPPSPSLEITPHSTPTPAPPSPTITPVPTTPAPTPFWPDHAVVTAHAAHVPAEFRYVRADGSSARQFLVDLGSGAVTEVLSAVVGDGGSMSVSSSADGRHLLLVTAGARMPTRLSVVDVEAGSIRMLWEDSAANSSYAISSLLSPDGASYAFMDADGVRIGSSSGGPTRLIARHVDPQLNGGSWSSFAFSPDGRWLGLVRASEANDEVAIVATDTGRLVTVGSGTMLAWRRTAPELLVMSGVNAFGGRSMSYLYDVTTGRKTSLESVGRETRSAPLWSPSETTFAYTAADSIVSPRTLMTRRVGDSAPVKVADLPSSIADVWWSRDGSRFYALRYTTSPRVPAVTNLDVVDLSTGRVITTVCRDPQACP